jgi:diacylglycerol kinase (ATP)
LSGPAFVVFNPASGKGRGAEMVAPVLRCLGDFQAGHALSGRPGEESQLAAAAIQRGHKTIVAVGGDGTWSNVAGAIIESGQQVALGLVAAGTGCDFAKTLGIAARDPVAATAVIKGGHTRLVDAGRVEGRYFINIAGFGLDIAVVEDSLQVRWLRGDLLYIYCALRQLVRFGGFELEVSADDAAPVRQRLLMFVAANARIFGGGFQIAPQADLGDGKLDAVGFADTSFWRRLVLMARLLRGSHESQPETSTGRAARLRLRFDAPPLYETDGELRRALSTDLTIESVPGALRVLVPAP